MSIPSIVNNPKTSSTMLQSIKLVHKYSKKDFPMLQSQTIHECNRPCYFNAKCSQLFIILTNGADNPEC